MRNLKGKISSKLMQVVGLSVLLLCISLGGCRDLRPRVVATEPASPPKVKPSEQIIEVAPPPAIRELRQKLDKYQPQVQILSPSPDQVLTDTTVAVQLQVNDLPLFKNETLSMGPHLHLILDNEPYQAIYDVSQPVVLENLDPGTHTLRVFASRPWHESFKNETAYAQTTFHLFTKTNKNNPDPAFPLLTYSRPKGEYGAEPVMLDFYLTNAPLHLVAQESREDSISDWRVQVTINGQTFPLDNWQPIYLKGFKKGKNWVQLAFLDEQGQEIDNTFNNTVRLIDYTPGGEDTLSKLVRGELTPEEALGIVDPTAQVIPAAEPEAPAMEAVPEVPTDKTTEEAPEEVVPEEMPEIEEEALTEPSEAGEESLTEELPAGQTAEEPPEAVEPVVPEAETEILPEEDLEITEEAPALAPIEPPSPETEKPSRLKPVRNFFQRFRKEKAPEKEEVLPTPEVTSPGELETPDSEATTPAPEMTLPGELETPEMRSPADLDAPEAEDIEATEKPAQTTPETEKTTIPSSTPSLEVTPQVETKPEIEPPPVIKEPELPEPVTPEPAEKQSLESDLPPTLPEIVEDAPVDKSLSQEEVEEKVIPKTSSESSASESETEALTQ